MAIKILIQYNPRLGHDYSNIIPVRSMPTNTRKRAPLGTWLLLIEYSPRLEHAGVIYFWLSVSHFPLWRKIINPFRTAVPFWEQSTWNLIGLSPKWYCSSKRVDTCLENHNLIWSPLGTCPIRWNPYLEYGGVSNPLGASNKEHPRQKKTRWE